MIFILTLIGLVLLGLSTAVILGIGYSIYIYSIEAYISYFIIFLSFITVGILGIIWIVYIFIFIENKGSLLKLSNIKIFKGFKNIIGEGKNVRRILLTLFILIVVGTIGSVFSGIYMIPKLSKSVDKKIENINLIENQILKTSKDIQNLNLNFNTHDYEVEIRKSLDNNTYIKECEDATSYINIDGYYDKLSKSLSIRVYNHDKPLNNLSFKNGIEDFLVKKTIKDNYLKKVIIEVPNKVNININSLGKTGNSKINIKDKDTLLDKFILKDVNSNIKIPYFNSLKEINIKDSGDIRLDLRSIINAEKIEIKGLNIKLYSGGSISDYDLDNIPKCINIAGENIEITSFIPLGETSNIYSKNWLYLQMPFDDYGLYGGIIGLKSIDTKPNTNEIQNEDLITLINTNFSLKNNTYVGNYSKNKESKYKMNVTLSEGVIINSLYNIIEGIVLGYE